MAVSEDLIGFVRDALGRGLTRSHIEELLLRAGWPAEQVRAALAAYADIDSPVPVPRPKPYTSAAGGGFAYYLTDLKSDEREAAA
jgi:hypothetical protein